MTTRTVLLTGISGFIAKHIAVRLLDEGFAVRGSVRSLGKADAVHDALLDHVRDKSSVGERLSFVELDLGSDDGWDEAMRGIDVLMHTASPFPMVQPKDERDLIGPAVEGTLRALRAARTAGIDRVVLTSSVAAIMEGNHPGRPLNEDDWTDPALPAVNAYSRSKTLAEKAAWDFVAREAPGMKLTVINPGFVLGPALDGDYGTSLAVIERLLRARDPMLPRFGFTCVDVRDIADMHVRAIDATGAAGQRFAGVAGFIWFSDMARIVKGAFPDRKIPLRVAPDVLIRVLGLFDPAIRTIVPMLGVRQDIDSNRARAVLGTSFRPLEESVRDAAASIIRYKGL